MKRTAMTIMIIIVICFTIGCCWNNMPKRNLPSGGVFDLNPEDYWAHELEGSNNISIYIRLEPSNITIIPMIFDENNYNKFINNQTFETYINGVSFNQSIPVKDGFTGYVNTNYQTLYLVIKNIGVDKGRVTIGLGAAP